MDKFFHLIIILAIQVVLVLSFDDIENPNVKRDAKLPTVNMVLK